MEVIRAIIKLPPLIWIFGICGGLYYIHMNWENEILTPLQEEILTAKDQLARLEKQNADAEAFKAQRDTRLQEVQNLAEKFNQTLEKLPRSSDTPGLLSNLSEIADRVGVEFTRFEPGRPEASGFLMETPFKVELQGTFVQIMSFMDEVAHLKRIVSGKSLSLKDPSLRGQSAVLKAEATLVTFYFDETGKGAAAENSLQDSALPQQAPPLDPSSNQRTGYGSPPPSNPLPPPSGNPNDGSSP